MKTPFQYEIISRLKKAREDKNFTQASIAKHLEISPGQLGNIESYKQDHKFTLAQILKICDLLEIKIEEVLLPSKGVNVEIRDVIEAIVKYQEKVDE
jgi:transcriptional regulator with XRE-family HTH domain